MASLGNWSLPEMGRVRWVSFLVWVPANLFRYGVLLIAGLEKDNPLSLSLALPLLVADTRSEYVCVLVWFHLGILNLILISILYGVPDRLCSDFLDTFMMKRCGSWEMGGCLHPLN
jgi:hypothetical protein